jgi:hypothetical protein
MYATTILKYATTADDVIQDLAVPVSILLAFGTVPVALLGRAMQGLRPGPRLGHFCRGLGWSASAASGTALMALAYRWARGGEPSGASLAVVLVAALALGVWLAARTRVNPEPMRQAGWRRRSWAALGAVAIGLGGVWGLLIFLSGPMLHESITLSKARAKETALAFASAVGAGEPLAPFACSPWPSPAGLEAAVAAAGLAGCNPDRIDFTFDPQRPVTTVRCRGGSSWRFALSYVEHCESDAEGVRGYAVSSIRRTTGEELLVRDVSVEPEKP